MVHLKCNFYVIWILTQLEKAYILSKWIDLKNKKKEKGRWYCDSFPFWLGDNWMTFSWGGREDKNTWRLFFPFSSHTIRTKIAKDVAFCSSFHLVWYGWDYQIWRPYHLERPIKKPMWCQTCLLTAQKEDDQFKEKLWLQIVVHSPQRRCVRAYFLITGHKNQSKQPRENQD